MLDPSPGRATVESREVLSVARRVAPALPARPTLRRCSARRAPRGPRAFVVIAQVGKRRLGFVVDRAHRAAGHRHQGARKVAEGRPRLRGRDGARRPARRAGARRGRPHRRGAGPGRGALPRRRRRREDLIAMAVARQAPGRKARGAPRGRGRQEDRVPRVRARRRDVRGPRSRSSPRSCGRRPITEVPRAPTHGASASSASAGKLVTVLDLRRRLRLAEAPIDRRSRILLVESGGGEQIGLLVDEVQQVWRLALDEIEPAQRPRGRSGRAHRGDRPARRDRRHDPDPARPAASRGGRLR